MPFPLDGGIEIEAVAMGKEQDVAEKVCGLVFQRDLQGLLVELLSTGAAAQPVPGLREFAHFFNKLEDEPVVVPQDAVHLGVVMRRLLEVILKFVQHARTPFVLFLFQ
ncbi:hypothetical protein [Rhizobium sp. PP-CC-3G-465]|uniref:hypothetical protein n=1 Tax=Rhizobium sp. PP-CC-3G-465 TaxID=2135648 RepID=UPI001A9D3580